MIKTKLLKSFVPIALLLTQQLCLCLVLCNALHEHRQADESAFHQATQTVPAGDCDETQHIEKCDKEKLNRVGDSQDVIPAAPALPEKFCLFAYPPASCPEKPEPDLREKIFLQLHILRC